MKRIDEYVNKIYRNAKGNKKEIEESKEEMKSHLYESVQELVSEGKSEREAISIAIDRFGKEQELSILIKQVFQAQKTFGDRIIQIGIGVFLVSILIFSLTLLSVNTIKNEQETMAKEIIEILYMEDELSEAGKEKVENLMHDARFTVGQLVIKQYGGEEIVLYDYLAYDNRIVGKFYSAYFYGAGNYGVFIESFDYSIVGLVTFLFGIGTLIFTVMIGFIIRTYHKRSSKLIHEYR